MLDNMYATQLDELIFRYSHPNLKRSGILYLDDDRIDLLEVNRLVKTLNCKSDFTVQLAVIRSWVFYGRDELTIN